MKIAICIAIAAYFLAGLIACVNVKLPRFLISKQALVAMMALVILTWPVFYLIGIVDRLRARIRINRARRNGRLNGEI
jgi:hypothetical protein